MMRNLRLTSARWLAALLVIFLSACSRDPSPAPTKTEVTLEPGVFSVENPQTFKLARIESRSLPVILNATGTVSPDVTRTIHVTSLGSGRVIELKVRLGDQVRKGQVLLTISSSDMGAAIADYEKARTDEELARKALDRAQLLNSHGALADKDLQLAQNAAEKARVDLEAAARRVSLLGGDPNHPSPLIQLKAPVSGTIVEQNVAGFEGVKSLDNSPNLFTIADLSQVWVLCDVYENDLAAVRIGDKAEIRLNAFPDQVLHGTIGDISRVLDPSTRSAKVRVVLPNPDRSLRSGMYTTATFRSRQTRPRLVVPSSAIMRLQDRDWVFRKEGPGRFHQVEVHTLGQTGEGLQQIQDGAVQAGEEVVLNALDFSAAMAERKQ